MTDSPDDRADQSPPADDASQVPETTDDKQIQPADTEKRDLIAAGVVADATTAKDEQIELIVQDNDVRLWYITKYGEGKFGIEELKKLVEVRRKFRDNPEYMLTDAEEVAYRQATMAATQFLGSRHPEAIRLYALVQGRRASNPLQKWLWGIGIALLLALFSNGFQTLLGNQIRKMADAQTRYVAQTAQLALPTVELTDSLSRMCDLTLAYRAAASALEILLAWLPSADDAESRARENTAATGEYKAPGVCSIIGSTTMSLPDEKNKRQKIVIDARRHQIGSPDRQAVRLQAEMVDSVLTLFLLPMLYALLGALTSGIRTANNAFKSMTLTRVDGISLGARVLLGVVGGATIGIVFSADQLGGVGGLTVLGLAFAAGYAVDLFFNLLDGLKVGLGGTPPRG